MMHNTNSPKKIAIIGAGNGGQAIAGHLALEGHFVSIYNRSFDRLLPIQKQGGILIDGKVNGFAKLKCISNRIQDVLLDDTEVIMVVTTADAHRDLAYQMAPFLKSGQTIILNPGRTGGALEMRAVWKKSGMLSNIFLAEAQSLVFACRIVKSGHVHIIGIKNLVPLASYPCHDINIIFNSASSLYKCFQKAPHVLVTSFENIGAIFHPAITLFNAATIERGVPFLFYSDLTPRIVDFLMRIDEERIRIGAAYGLKLSSAEDWVVQAYPNIQGDNFCDKLRANPAYHSINAPTSIYTRYLYEDISTGLVPFTEFAKLAGVNTPLMNSLIDIGSALINFDFRKNGRTFKKLGLNKMTISKILSLVTG